MSRSPDSHPLPEYDDEPADFHFWEAAVPRREPLRWRAFLPVLAGLLVLNVPWYLPAAMAERRFWGLPLFAWIALATSVAISALVAIAALRHWDDDEPERLEIDRPEL